MNKADFSYSVSHFIVSQCGVDNNDQLLVALSGGADSVALLRVLLDLGYRCVAAHCNFHLRDEESMRDDRFVRSLCSTLDVPLRVRDFDVETCRRERGISVEMACRELRYSWFNELLKSDNCDFVAVAHHRDDNIETMFLNMLRGTGIAGLTGMKPRNGNVIRPLLCVSRADIIEYLSQIGQDYVTDSTNLTNEYQRNKVRNVLLREIDKEFPQGRDRIADTISNLAEFQELYDELVADVISQCLEQQNDEKQVYSLAPLKRFSQPKLLLHAILARYGFKMEQCELMATKIHEENQGFKAHFYASTNAVTLTCENIVIEKVDNVEKIDYKVDFSSHSNLPVKLEVLRREMPLDLGELDGKFTVAFDESLLNCERIVLRHWREGDRMKPFGMKGTRLLSDIFSDVHLTLQQKRRLWLLEADGEILWILGMRAAEAYRVTASSKGYVEMRVDDHSMWN
ncbi:MAG: tRNA lysidine(34) synthetase TilS [Muribaculaceae bacterium]|nr:tRNA lysidine(34) synthetase TilS [Muribaculaceae bacterium]